MAINTTNGATVITGDHIHAYRLLLLLRSMEFEVQTGIMMTSRSKANPFKIVRQEFGIKARKKDQVASEFRKILEAKGLVEPAN